MLYALFFVVLILLELLYFRIANRFRIVDKPNHRSSHHQITIRGGGIVFYAGLLLYVVWYGVGYSWLLVGATLLAVVSFIDDLRPVSPAVRLLIQFLAIALMLYGCGMNELAWYWWPIALILTAGTINVYNFMDGINGITVGYSLVTMAGLWYANNYLEAFVDNHLLYLICLSLVVFGIFNFRKQARCFSGDVGSITMAFLICFMLVSLIQVTGNFSFLVLLSVYGIDATYTIVYRLMKRERITEAHRTHLYQIMANELNIPHLIVAALYMSLQLLITAGFFLFYKQGYLYFAGVILVLTVVYLVFRVCYCSLTQKR